ncbi:hypothetical protein X769_33115 [Mesorhizobium sp. LSJC268A00]|uniref:aminotransferase class V-fold PLP-dependent enzyme n=1 Tax=unclassified Mesorhizobium TaxID=325217 RepID=UPI0003CDF5F1|nr:aminotransferase class V-fold PLP-dependent enzyme [Mesorhizobium sp. LSJC268A00]ESW94355.1 hypothetical protein X769_33115 [Mesorhizobium sp. LSJC268A00]
MNSSLLPLSAIREEFPATQKLVYMDVANQGLISRTTRVSFEQHLDNRLRGENDELSQLEGIEKTRARFAQLIGADQDEIAITKNASESINIIANAINWRPGDSVVLCPQLEHANNILPWLQVKAIHNVQLKVVEPHYGAFPVEKIINALDSSTRVVALSTATMVPGFRTATEQIAQACRRRGSFLLADGTQSVGILHTNVAQLGLDGLAVSTVKGLMGLYGSGFLFCRREWADQFNPAYLARFSVDLGNAPESAPILSAAKLRAGAPRFDIGHYNFPGMIAAYASMGQLLEIGTEAIDSHVTSLAKRLALGLLQLGLPVCGGPPGKQTGSIVAVGDMAMLSGDREPAPYIQALQSHLNDHKVIASKRRGLLRFSLHLYNSEAEVDHVIDLIKSWRS